MSAPAFIGLTGAIAAGKSEALAALERLGAATLSSDAIVHELLESGRVRDLLVARWGEDVAPGGTVDRSRVGRIVFERPEELAWLEATLHPLVRERIASWRAELPPAATAAVVEVPLLFENDLDPLFDATIAILAADPLRAERAEARGTDDLERRAGLQLSQAEKAARATYTVTNDGTLAELEGAARRTAREDRRRRAGGAMTKRRRLALAALVLGGAVAFALSRIDVEDAIREVTLPLRHDDIIRQQAEEKDLDPALIAAVIYAESRFRDQTSQAGARGLMQVTPATALAIAEQTGGVAFRVEDLGTPQINISYGSRHLRDLLDAYAGNLVAALAAYNAGSGNVDDWGGAGLEIDDIRFAETRAYVEQVLEKREEYRDAYAEDLGL